MRRRRYLAGIATGVPVGLAGCNSGTFGPSDRELTERRAELADRHDVVVSMETPDNVFVPETVTVPVGGSVAWLNDSGWSHTVTAVEDEIPADADYFTTGGFDTERAARDAWPDGDLAVGESFAHTFSVAGEFPYVCIPHDGMTGTVVVEAETGTTASPRASTGRSRSERVSVDPE